MIRDGQKKGGHRTRAKTVERCAGGRLPTDIYASRRRSRFRRYVYVLYKTLTMAHPELTSHRSTSSNVCFAIPKTVETRASVTQ